MDTSSQVQTRCVHHYLKFVLDNTVSRSLIVRYIWHIGQATKFGKISDTQKENYVNRHTYKHPKQPPY